MENQKFVLTTEMLEKARTYMPLEVKNQLAKDIAETVLVDVDYKTLDVVPDLMAVPPLKIERQDLKAICLQRAFLSFYFGFEFADSVDAVEVYDYYGEAHPLNQLIRLKSDANLKNKAFDIEADYKEFRKFVETEIYNLKLVHTDVVTRLIKGISLFATPEMVEKMSDNLKVAMENVGKTEE